MKVTAEKIGNGSKERILIDGEVFIKSTAADRWNYIVEVEVMDGYNKGTFIGKSATRETAEKWQPFQMSIDHIHPMHVRPELREEYAASYKKALQDGAVEANARYNGFSQKVARMALTFTRKVYKIERAGV